MDHLKDENFSLKMRLQELQDLLKSGGNVSPSSKSYREVDPKDKYH